MYIYHSKHNFELPSIRQRMANLLKNKEDQQVKINKPDWLKVKIPSGKEYLRVKDVVETRGLHTICSSGKCPNQSECWTAGTATFMILGNTCTRSCQFCNVATGAGEEVDIFEPAKVAESIRVMGHKTRCYYFCRSR